MTFESGGAFRVTRKIGSVAGLRYEVESSTTLEADSWSAVSGVTITPVSDDGVTETVDLTRATGWDTEIREFYRLKISFVN